MNFREEKHKRSTLRHFIIKLLKARDRENLESSNKEVTVIYKGDSVRKRLDFLAGTMEARWQWDDIFKVHRERENP